MQIRSISSRFADFLLAFLADSVDFVASFRRDLQTSSWRFLQIRSISARRFVAIRSVSSRFGRFRRVVSCRHRRRHHDDTDTKTQKKPDSSIGESGLSYRKVSRALNLLLAPLSSTCASGRSVLLGLARRVVSCRFGRFRRDLQTSSWRFVTTPKARHKKKPDSSIVDSGFSYRKVSCALNLLLAPLSSTCASVRGVLLGLARRFCIVMITSDRRHIVHYT